MSLYDVALGVDCSDCGATVGRPCRNPSGHLLATPAHLVRRQAVHSFPTERRTTIAPIEVAFFADAPDAVIANVIRDMAASGRVVLDIRLMSSPLSVISS